MLNTFQVKIALNLKNDVPVDAKTFQEWLKSRIEGDSNLLLKVSGTSTMAKFNLSVIEVKDG
jgi:hypothetical protein